MTIATGFDIGQHSADYLKGVTGLSSSALAQLLPYANQRFPHMTKADVIDKIGKLGPIR